MFCSSNKCHVASLITYVNSEMFYWLHNPGTRLVYYAFLVSCIALFLVFVGENKLLKYYCVSSAQNLVNQFLYSCVLCCASLPFCFLLNRPCFLQTFSLAKLVFFHHDVAKLLNIFKMCRCYITFMSIFCHCRGCC